MEQGIGIAGVSDIIGLVCVVLSIVVVAIMLQRMKGPRDREPQN